MAFKKVTPEEISHCLLNDASIRFDLSDDTVVAHPGFRGDPLTISFPRLLPLDLEGSPFIPGYSLVEQLKKGHQICRELDGGAGAEFVHVYTGRYDGASENFEFTEPDDATHLFLTEQHNGCLPLHNGVDSDFGKAYSAVWYYHEDGDNEDDSAMSYWIIPKNPIPHCLEDHLEWLAAAEKAMLGTTRDNVYLNDLVKHSY